MLVPLTPEEREDMKDLLSSWGDVAMPASIAEIEWGREAKDYAARLADAGRAWRAHLARHPAYRPHIRRA